MEQNQTSLTQAYWTLGDWFRRLGGSARYPGFREAEIPLYIVVVLAKQHKLPITVDTHTIDQRFLDAAAHILPQVRKHLDLIRAEEGTLIALLKSFVDHADAKLKEMPEESTSEWRQAVRDISALARQNHVGQ